MITTLSPHLLVQRALHLLYSMDMYVKQNTTYSQLTRGDAHKDIYS